MADGEGSVQCEETSDEKGPPTKDSSQDHETSDQGDISPVDKQTNSPVFATPESEDLATSTSNETTEQNDSKQAPSVNDTVVHTGQDTNQEAESQSDNVQKDTQESETLKSDKKKGSKSEKGASTGADAAKPDIDRDSRNPAFVPRSGRFFEHDDRVGDSDADAEADATKAPEQQSDVQTNSASKQQSSASKSAPAKAVDTRRSRADANSRWSHDLFDVRQQAPKSSHELNVRYGSEYKQKRTAGQPRPTSESNEQDAPQSHNGQNEANQSDERGQMANTNANRNAVTKRADRNTARAPRPKAAPNSDETGPQRTQARRNEQQRPNNRRKTSQRATDDAENEEECLAYDDAALSDGDERATDSKVDSSAQNAQSQARAKPARAAKRQSKSSERDAEADVDVEEDVHVLHRRPQPQARTVLTRPNYSHSRGYEHRYDREEYAYPYESEADDQRRPTRGRNDVGPGRARNVNGARPRRDRYPDYDYTEDYGATRGGRPSFPHASQSRRSAATAEFYYEDPADTRVTLHGRGRAAPRATYTARSNRSGIDADRWTHDRADVPAQPAASSAPSAQTGRQNQRTAPPNTKRAPASGPNGRANQQAQPDDSQHSESSRKRANAAESQPRTNTAEGDNGELQTTNSARVARNAKFSETQNRSKATATRNAPASGSLYETSQTAYENAAPSGVELASQTYAAGAYYGVTSAQPSTAASVPTSNGVVTSDQLNVLFDAFSAATAQFAPTVSNQILQTVAHTLMMHGAPGPAGVDTQSAEPYAVPPTGNALGLPVGVGVGVGAPTADSSMLSMVGVPMPVMPPGTMIAPLGVTYPAMSQPEAAYSKPTTFSPAMQQQQPRRARAPLEIVNPKDVKDVNPTRSRRADAWKQPAASYAPVSSEGVGTARADAR